MTKTIEAIWQLLQQHQGEIFHTAKGLPFTYSIRGGELFVNRRRKSITVSTVRRALEKLHSSRPQGRSSPVPRKSAATGPATFTRCCWRWTFWKDQPCRGRKNLPMPQL